MFAKENPSLLGSKQLHKKSRWKWSMHVWIHCSVNYSFMTCGFPKIQNTKNDAPWGLRANTSVPPT